MASLEAADIVVVDECEDEADRVRMKDGVAERRMKGGVEGLRAPPLVCILPLGRVNAPL